MRSRWVFSVLPVLFLVFVGTGPVAATSLWSGQGSLYADTRARQVGDLVTLIIVEKSQAQQNAATTTGKDGSVNIGPGFGLLDILPLLRVEGGDSLSSGGSTSRGGQLTARMTTRVVEVLPNGNLVIEGRQVIRINEEEQEIRVTGVVRPQDIARDNTVLSTFVADADITFKGTGPLGDKQEPGLLTRIFNWLF